MVVSRNLWKVVLVRYLRARYLGHESRLNMRTKNRIFNSILVASFLYVLLWIATSLWGCESVKKLLASEIENNSKSFEITSVQLLEVEQYYDLVDGSRLSPGDYYIKVTSPAPFLVKAEGQMAYSMVFKISYLWLFSVRIIAI